MSRPLERHLSRTLKLAIVVALDSHHIWALDEEDTKHAPHQTKDQPS